MATAMVSVFFHQVFCKYIHIYD